MEVSQIYQLTNAAAQEVLGENDILLEDLSSTVALGEAVFNANAVDRFVKSLVNQIGKVIFVNRPYIGKAPNILMDSWEYGSVLEKIRSEMPDAVENESWELEDGASYDPNIFHQPTVAAKFWNSKTTFEIDHSIADRQVKQSLQSASQLNGFISMLMNEVEKSLTVRTDALIMRTINNLIAETLAAEFPSADYGDGSGVKAINLLYLYNQLNSTATIDAEHALSNREFLRFAAYQMGLWLDRMQAISVLFNVGGKERFTNKADQHLVMLSEFAKAADVYLSSDTFHDELVKLPTASTVPFWQGSGDDYSFDQTSGIYVKTQANNTVQANGILAVLFDKYACGVHNYDRRVTAHYNAKAEFTNYFVKQDAGYFNDLDENCIVFYIADETT